MAEVTDYTGFFADITPFVIFYVALFVRILDNREIFSILFKHEELPDCEIIKQEGCPLKWENPMAKAHHEFIFTNISASFIIIGRLLLNNDVLGFPRTTIWAAIRYLIFSFIVVVVGLKVDWKGVDSIFFSLIAMSVPFYYIFTISNYYPFYIFSLRFPLGVSLINGLMFILLAILQRYVLFK